MGQNRYRPIVSTEWHQCDFVFDHIVMILFLQTYLDTVLLHTKIC